MTQCPQCLGTGKVKAKKRKTVSSCKLCESSGYVKEEIAEDFIHSINPNYYEEEINSY